MVGVGDEDAGEGRPAVTGEEASNVGGVVGAGVDDVRAVGKVEDVGVRRPSRSSDRGSGRRCGLMPGGPGAGRNGVVRVRSGTAWRGLEQADALAVEVIEPGGGDHGGAGQAGGAGDFIEEKIAAEPSPR